MDFGYLVLMAIISFGAFYVLYYFYKKDAAFILAIGAAINSNIFNSNAYGIEAWGLTFGIDSVIYTLFIFCVAVVYIEYNKKDAFSLTWTTIASIIFSGIISLLASCATSGYSSEFLGDFISFLVSCVATLLAVWAMIYAVEKWKIKNVYVKLTIMIIIGTIINSLAYFGISAIIEGVGSFGTTFYKTLIASYIGKFMSLLFSIATYYIYVITRRKPATPHDKVNE